MLGKVSDGLVFSTYYIGKVGDENEKETAAYIPINITTASKIGNTP